MCTFLDNDTFEPRDQYLRNKLMQRSTVILYRFNDIMILLLFILVLVYTTCSFVLLSFGRNTLTIQ